MRELVVQQGEGNQRLDKFLGKYMEQAPKSFFYKMLRKKNIKLNGKKAEGNEKLEVGDKITLFLSEETIESFRVSSKQSTKKTENTRKIRQIPIIYEDQHIIFMNKPSGLLTQRADKKEDSLNDWLLTYVEMNRKQEGNIRVKPSVCNRLDRNTSGLVIGGISLVGLQTMTQLLKERRVQKYYLAIVRGQVKSSSYLKGWMKKDEKRNKIVMVSKEEEGAMYIETTYEPLCVGRDVTLLKVGLITGRTHQIRGHLASIGHSIVGDTKYGEQQCNRIFRERYGVQDQLLHAYQIKFEQVVGELSYLSNKSYQAPIPRLFGKVMQGEKLTLQEV